MTTTESQITSGKAESTIDDDQQFQKLHGAWIGSREYFQDDSHPTVQADWKAFIALIEAVREKDRKEAFSKALDEFMTAKDELKDEWKERAEKAESALAANQPNINNHLLIAANIWQDRAQAAEAERDHWKAEAETWKGAAAHDFGDEPRHIVARQAAGLAEAISGLLGAAGPQQRETASNAARLILKEYRAALLSPAQQEPATLPGVSDPDCNYLWLSGSVCTKCGRIHRGNKEGAITTNTGWGFAMVHKTGPDRGFSWNHDDPQFSSDWTRVPLVPKQATPEGGHIKTWNERAEESGQEALTADQCLKLAEAEIKNLRAALVPTRQALEPNTLFDRKLAHLQQRGYEVIGRILHKDGEYALFDRSCRWLTQPQYWRLMHEQDGSLFAESKAAEPVIYVRVCDIDGTFHSGLVQGFKTAEGDWNVPLYRAAPLQQVEKDN